jgi:hypothetical protein
MTDTTDPVDALHQECVDARRDVRVAFAEARQVAAEWEPRPAPRRD